MAEHNELGRKGEMEALVYLKQKGFEIKEVNYKIGKLEIDIIAIDKNELVIVEVKTRGRNDIINPEEAVTQKKQQHLIKAAHQYITSHNTQLNTRFDIVTVIYQDGTKIEHIADAFYPKVRR
jgi:putative endonuclease